MQRWRGADRAPAGWGRSVATVGVFDGVHRGHQAIIARAVGRARDLSVASLLVTFDPHPSEVVRPGSHPAVLTSPARKAELVAGLGVEALCVLPFTREFSRLPAADFVHRVLVGDLHAVSVVVGADFRFGHRATGDVALLRRLGEQFGFTTIAVPMVAGEGGRFSSTAIRAAVAAGDVVAAASALGREHRVEGVVVRGDGRGREIGYPTANVETLPYAALPADGIYAGRLVRDPARAAIRLPAALSIGTNPTFSGSERRLEAYVLDFDDDLYGQHVAVDFTARIRETRRFAGPDELAAAIAADVATTRRLLG